jgi:hypothetical protein
MEWVGLVKVLGQGAVLILLLILFIRGNKYARELHLGKNQRERLAENISAVDGYMHEYKNKFNCHKHCKICNSLIYPDRSGTAWTNTVVGNTLFMYLDLCDKCGYEKIRKLEECEKEKKNETEI